MPPSAIREALDPSGPLIVKIGGSLVRTAGQIDPILRLLTGCPRPIVVVPGGGPFADVVRAEQQRLGFSDLAAHRMAILAMHQMAEVLAERLPRGEVASGLDSVSAALARGRLPVWQPLSDVAGVPELPASWDVTSDAIACWLADRMSARGLVILKSCPVDPAAAPAELARRGILDPVAAGMLNGSARPAWIIGAPHAPRLSQIIARTFPVDGAASAC